MKNLIVIIFFIFSLAIKFYNFNIQQIQIGMTFFYTIYGIGFLLFYIRSKIVDDEYEIDKEVEILDKALDKLEEFDFNKDHKIKAQVYKYDKNSNIVSINMLERKAKQQKG